MKTRSLDHPLRRAGCVRGVGVLILLCLASLSLARAADRPNILLILADNWRWPNAGALGDPMARHAGL
jgi:N-sulfoglucosamine sulfohydrolase